jgi:hypothetical protein
LQVGDLLAGRYLLLDPVAHAGPVVLWRATDQVLARSVAVRVLPTPNKASKAQATPFLAAAAQASQATHPGLVRVLDAGVDTRPGRSADVTYLVREWVDGEPLDLHLARVGALSALDAADVLRQLADALTAAHSAGMAHGRVHPGNILIGSNGRVRLTDAMVGAVGQAPDPLGPVAADTRDVAAVLYALLTGRWPVEVTPQPAGTLLPAPDDHGLALAPHRVRAGVPLALDRVLSRTLTPGRMPMLPPLVTPAQLADAVDAATAHERQERAVPATPPPPGFARRHAGPLAAAGVVTLFALVGWFAGLSIGELPRVPGAVDAIVVPSSGPTASLAPALSLKAVTITDFDPAGDKQESPDQVDNALDGDATTAWPTTRYKSASFGGLKTGVGLLLDLGSVRTVRSVEVDFTAPGAKVQLRVSRTLPSTAPDGQLVASSAAGTTATLTPGKPVATRYVLVWLTQLPEDGDGYRVGISEIRLR